MFLPLRTDSPLRRTPWMNWALIAANVIVFVLQKQFDLERKFALAPANLHLINYFTYQFLHANVLHIAGNMLFLYIFGNNVNDRMGQAGYLAFYLAGGVCAGIGHVLSSGAPVIGASGAISAVTAAYLVLLPQSHITIIYWFFLIGQIELPSVWFIVFFFVKDFIAGFGGETDVAHLAHISGSVFGFIICFVLLGFHLLPRDSFDLFAVVKQWNRRRQYRDIVSSGYDPFAVVTTKAKNDPRLIRIQDIRAQISEAISDHDIIQAAKLYLELRAIDPTQVLSRQNQLEVANQLLTQEMRGAAADAYALFVLSYPKYEEIDQIELMLGLLYARYLQRPDLARQHLETAVTKLRNPSQIEMAKLELAHLAPTV